MNNIKINEIYAENFFDNYNFMKQEGEIIMTTIFFFMNKFKICKYYW